MRDMPCKPGLSYSYRYFLAHFGSLRHIIGSNSPIEWKLRREALPSYLVSTTDGLEGFQSRQRWLRTLKQATLVGLSFLEVGSTNENFVLGDIFLEWCKQYGNTYYLGLPSEDRVGDSSAVLGRFLIYSSLDLHL